jgi:hypothetical protein
MSSSSFSILPPVPVAGSRFLQPSLWNFALFAGTLSNLWGAPPAPPAGSRCRRRHRNRTSAGHAWAGSTASIGLGPRASIAGCCGRWSIASSTRGTSLWPARWRSSCSRLQGSFLPSMIFMSSFRFPCTVVGYGTVASTRLPSLPVDWEPPLSFPWDILCSVVDGGPNHRSV